jgi:uncharacterized protein (TIGR03083 family)
MDYLTPLRADYQRLASVASVSEAALARKVPTCPDWTLKDLVDHVAHVYLHKVECIRHNAAPDPWPAPGLDQGSRLDLLHRAYRELSDEFAARDPGSPAYTWFDGDHTVGFWMRRMAHETAIHRIDAELAAGVPSQPVPDDLALDGIDEVLDRFLVWPSTKWTEEFEQVLEPKQVGSVAISTGAKRWLVSWSPSGLVTAGAGDGAADAEIGGSPEAVLRWLWRRSDESLSVTGEETKVEQLRRLLGAGTQ